VSDAEGVVEERLDEQAKILDNATMPDGTIHHCLQELRPIWAFLVCAAKIHREFIGKS